MRGCGGIASTARRMRGSVKRRGSRMRTPRRHRSAAASTRERGTAGRRDATGTMGGAGGGRGASGRGDATCIRGAASGGRGGGRRRESRASVQCQKTRRLDEGGPRGGGRRGGGAAWGGERRLNRPRRA